jgi:hydroxymethylglutaryl-CoA reductase
VQMNEAQLDAVAAGQVQITDGLVNVTVGDITVQDIPVRILTNSINGNTVQIPVAANVNAVVAALGNAAGLARQYGRQN